MFKIILEYRLILFQQARKLLAVIL